MLLMLICFKDDCYNLPLCLMERLGNVAGSFVFVVSGGVILLLDFGSIIFASEMVWGVADLSSLFL